MSKVSNLNENKKLDIKTALTLVLKSEKVQTKAVMAKKKLSKILKNIFLTGEKNSFLLSLTI